MSKQIGKNLEPTQTNDSLASPLIKIPREIKGKLYNVSPETCLKIYLKIFKNADRTFQAALLLKQNGFYGQAVSVATASMEEYIKATILQLDGLGFNFRNTKGISRFFTEHSIRHVMAAVLLCIYMAGNNIVDRLKSLIRNPLELAAFIIMINDLEAMEKHLQQYIRTMASVMKAELPFFLEIENMRQLGYYCDFPDGFHSPDMINEAMCRASFDRFEKVRWIIKEFSEAIAVKDQQQQVKNIISMMKQHDFYQKLSDQLSGVKSDELFLRFEKLLERGESFSF